MDFIRDYCFTRDTRIILYDSDSMKSGYFTEKYEYDGHTHISFTNPLYGEKYVLNQFSLWNKGSRVDIEKDGMLKYTITNK
jgi:hypothetical protein